MSGWSKSPSVRVFVMVGLGLCHRPWRDSTDDELRWSWTQSLETRHTRREWFRLSWL